MAGSTSCCDAALDALGEGNKACLRTEAEEGDSAAEASELGRKEHWDAVYAGELANLREHGDEGELWYACQTVLCAIGLLLHAPGLLGMGPEFSACKCRCGCASEVLGEVNMRHPTGHAGLGRM